MLLEKINRAKSIVIVVNNETFCQGSALYTYVLQLHKKVSLVCVDETIERKYLFLPWYDKVKKNLPMSAEYTIVLGEEKENIHRLFKQKNVKINIKMAQALYGAWYEAFEENREYGVSVEGLQNASELLQLGANHSMCYEHLRVRPLSYLRLQAKVLKSMRLRQSAKRAEFCVSEEDLLQTGSSIEDAKNIALEGFRLASVSEVVLINTDTQEYISVRKKENRFEK